MTKTKVKKISEKERNTLYERIWEIDLDDKRPGTWWWWFWIFFIENKDNQSKPQQLMILWSTKNDSKIKCNNLNLKLDNEIKVQKNKSTFNGAVATWYFDGKKMHENHILENCDITLNKKPYALVSESKNKTLFCEKNNKFVVQINKGKTEFVFNSEIEANNEFVTPTLTQNNYLKGTFSHKVLRMPRLDFKGIIKNQEKEQNIRGTAYFQQVVVNSPLFPWYWGIFHFGNGSIVSYFNPHIGTAMLKDNLTKTLLSNGNISLKKGIYFFDKKAKKLHLFKNIKIKKQTNQKNQPVFKISGENKDTKISFTVDCYANAFWKFEKKFLGIVKMRLKYNEYPAQITQFNLQDKQGKTLAALKDLGTGIGNAEHSWGLLA